MTTSLMASTFTMSAANANASATDTIGNFLLCRLHQLGLKHMFGVPGDFNLLFLDQVEDFQGIDWIGNCNELNAAYAADGYGRLAGISALAVTYGVGELSALNGVAGAYAERVPMVVIVGSPASYNMAQRNAVHHSLGDGNYDNTLAAFQPFTVAQARLTPQNFVSEIDRCLAMCVLEKRPVYIQIPSDIPTLTMPCPTQPLSLGVQGSDPVMLDAFMCQAMTCIQEAQRPVVLIDADVNRLGLTDAMQAFLDISKLSFAVMATAKGHLSEQHPQYLGLYNGAASRPEIRAAVEGSDCLITFGLRFLDSTTGAFSHQIDPANQLEIRDWSARVDNNDYYGLRMADVLSKLTTALADVLPPRQSVQQANAEMSASPSDTTSDSDFCHRVFWQRIQRLLRSGDTLVAENGTSMSGVLGLQLPEDMQVIGQPLWGSIGYTLPAFLGAAMARAERRPMLFIGDGSFQLVAQELSTILREEVKGTIFLINNDGYTIERLIHGEKAPYNDIQPWNYNSLCEVFAPGGDFDSLKVNTLEQLDVALELAGKAERLTFIEVVFERMDSPPMLKKLASDYARQSYGMKWALERQHSNA